jgi:serine/threonine protein phosphatase PrpC
MQVEARHVTPSEVHLDRMWRNLRVHDLGFDEDLQIDTAVVSIAAGDTIILTSDGIWRYVTNEDLISTSKAPTPELACRSLLDRARTAGSDDVMTVLVTTVPRQA